MSKSYETELPATLNERVLNPELRAEFQRLEKYMVEMLTTVNHGILLSYYQSIRSHWLDSWAAQDELVQRMADRVYDLKEEKEKLVTECEQAVVEHKKSLEEKYRKAEAEYVAVAHAQEGAAVAEAVREALERASACKRCHRRPVRVVKPLPLVAVPAAPHTRRVLSCDRCPFRCDRISNLRQHVTAMHSKIRPFACNCCPANFPNKTGLKRHFVAIHCSMDSRRFDAKCDRCNFSCFMRDDLKKHVGRMHNSHH